MTTLPLVLLPLVLLPLVLPLRIAPRAQPARYAYLDALVAVLTSPESS